MKWNGPVLTSCGQAIVAVYYLDGQWWFGNLITHEKNGPYKTEDQARVTAEYVLTRKPNDQSAMPPMR